MNTSFAKSWNWSNRSQRNGNLALPRTWFIMFLIWLPGTSPHKKKRFQLDPSSTEARFAAPCYSWGCSEGMQKEEPAAGSQRHEVTGFKKHSKPHQISLSRSLLTHYHIHPMLPRKLNRSAKWIQHHRIYASDHEASPVIGKGGIPILPPILSYRKIEYH